MSHSLMNDPSYPFNHVVNLPGDHVVSALLLPLHVDDSLQRLRVFKPDQETLESSLGIVINTVFFSFVTFLLWFSS